MDDQQGYGSIFSVKNLLIYVVVAGVAYALIYYYYMAKPGTTGYGPMVSPSPVASQTAMPKAK